MKPLNTYQYPHKPSRLSHSQLMLYLKDSEEYFNKYILKAPRIPQTAAMSVGSSFDAFIKCHLEGQLKGWAPSKIADTTRLLFEQQVEERNREFAWGAGMYVFSQYCSVGCDSRLLLRLSESVTEPVFEGEVETEIRTPVGMVPIIGYPDLWWTRRGGKPVILDWKVNGYCSKSGMSPSAGYSMIYNTELYGPRGDRKRHAKADERRIADPYHDQLGTYCMMLGFPAGAGAIEQIACKPIVSGVTVLESGTPPMIRVAIHDGDISVEDTDMLRAAYGKLWHAIQSGTIIPVERAEQLSRVMEHPIHQVMRVRKNRF